MYNVHFERTTFGIMLHVCHIGDSTNFKEKQHVSIVAESEQYGSKH